VKSGTLIANAVLLIWGAAVLLYALFGNPSSGAYGAGQVIATVFALVMVFAGATGVRRELRKRVS